MKKRSPMMHIGVLTMATLTFASTATTGTAAASPPSIADNSCRAELIPSESDPGGYEAVSWWNDETSCNGWWYRDMEVKFDPYDEKLELYVDNWFEDITDVYAEMRVYEKYSREVIDYDKHEYQVDQGNIDEKQPGTPDGTGNIGEGHWVEVRICGRPYNGEEQCSKWAYGVA